MRFRYRQRRESDLVFDYSLHTLVAAIQNQSLQDPVVLPAISRQSGYGRRELRRPESRNLSAAFACLNVGLSTHPHRGLRTHGFLLGPWSGFCQVCGTTSAASGQTETMLHRGFLPHPPSIHSPHRRVACNRVLHHYRSPPQSSDREAISLVLCDFFFV